MALGILSADRNCENHRCERPPSHPAIRCFTPFRSYSGCSLTMTTSETFSQNPSALSILTMSHWGLHSVGFELTRRLSECAKTPPTNALLRQVCSEHRQRAQDRPVKRGEKRRMPSPQWGEGRPCPHTHQAKAARSVFPLPCGERDRPALSPSTALRTGLPKG